MPVSFKVSSLEVVSTLSGDAVPGWSLCHQLRYFCGVVAVGTVGGYVYFIDLGLDDVSLGSGEIISSGLYPVSPRTKDVASKRQKAMSNGQHLCMKLDDSSHHRHSFVYRKPDDSSLKKFPAEEVSVTCLHYIPQTGKLAVGFNFGGYQLWKLYSPVLEYSCRLNSELAPVTNFAHQEPENDPKNFCYLWVTRSSLPLEPDQESIAFMSLYQLAYNEKEWYNGYGTFYKELMSVGLRFEVDLSADPMTPQGQDVSWSRVLGCYTVQNSFYDFNKESTQDESFEESIHGPDLSLCVVIWEAQETGISSNTRRYLGLFDMNRWYHAQMPSSLKSSTAGELCSYFAFYSLDSIIDVATPDNLLSVYVGYESLRKFVNPAPVAPEQHFYPSSLAFEAKCVLQTGVVTGRFLGTQRQVLMSLHEMGPSAFVLPTEMFNLCVYAGLIPRSLGATTLQPAQQRHALLSLCLDCNLIGVIKSFVTNWADGDYCLQGCSLKYLLDWAWEKVGQIKLTIDQTCAPLYDWSGYTVDYRSLQTLHQCQQKLLHMPTIFHAFISQSASATEQGKQELETRLTVIELILQHLNVVLWFIHRGLLPENDEIEEGTWDQYVYPASSLVSVFNQRRQELKKLHSNIGQTDLLMIDGLIDNMGPAVSQLWDNEGGNGLYPPPSLHMLMNIYLLEDIPLIEKHCVTLYLLLDLVSIRDSSDEEFAEKICQFGRAMSMSDGMVRLVQGFWLLDHKDFQESECVLTHPMIVGDVGSWQRQRIIKSLLYQGESKLALSYLRSRPFTSLGPEDVKLQLTVLLANNLTAKAWEYQRKCQDESNRRELLCHLFLGCQQTNTFVKLLELPLSAMEERHLVEYLEESREANSLEMLVMYYLQRGRYIEGIKLNEKLKHRAMGENNPRARERAAARNALVNGYFNILPAVQKKIVFETIPSVMERKTVNRVVCRPKPLSTVVSQSGHAKFISQSTLINAVMEKVCEITQLVESDSPLVNRLEKRESEIGPFMATPVTPMTERNFSQNQSIVYPRMEIGSKLNDTPQDDEGEESTLYPWKQLSDVTSDVYGKYSPKGIVAKRRLSRYMSASALSLLKTPPVQRKASLRSAPSSSAHPTPQSILKVRRLVQQSPSPKILSSSASSSTERLAQDSQVRSAVPKKLSLPDATPSPVSSRSILVTPKLLRFADNVKSASPSPTLVSSSTTFSSRSPPSPRSSGEPTPETLSPRHSPNVEHLERSPLRHDHCDDHIDRSSLRHDPRDEYVERSSLQDDPRDDHVERSPLQHDPHDQHMERISHDEHVERSPLQHDPRDEHEERSPLPQDRRDDHVERSLLRHDELEDVDMEEEEEVTFNLPKTLSQSQENAQEIEEDMATDSQSDEGEDVNMAEESDINQEVETDTPKDEPVRVSSSLIKQSTFETSSKEGGEDISSFSSMTSISGRSPIKTHQSFSEITEIMATSSSKTVTKTEVMYHEATAGGEAYSFDSKEADQSKNLSQLSVLHEASAALSKLETPDRSPSHSSLFGSTDEAELSPLKLQVSPLKLQVSSTYVDETIPAEAKSSQEVTPVKPSAKQLLSIDTSLSNYLIQSEQLSPCRRSPRLQSRQSPQTTPLHSPVKSGQVTPQKSAQKSRSLPQVTPKSELQRIPGSPTSINSSIQSSPIAVVRSSRRTTSLSVSQARLDHLDAAEGPRTRSRNSRSVSPLVLESVPSEAPSTPVKVSESTESMLMESTLSEATSLTEVEMTDTSDREKVQQQQLSTKNKSNRRSATRTPATPSTPTRQSSRIREREAQLSTPPASPSTSPVPQKATPRRSPGRSPGRPKGSTVKSGLKTTRIKELSEELSKEPSFIFSEPVEVERDANNDADRPSTPIHSFIFSPPLTRSQRRIGSADTSDVSSEAGVIPPPPEVITPVAQKKTPSRRGRKKKYEVPHPSPSYSPLNLISPIVQSSSTSDRSDESSKAPVQNLRKKVLRPRKKYGGAVW